MKISKIDGARNPADLMTKYLDGARIRALLSRLGMREYSGRHHLAPQLQGDSATTMSLLESRCVRVDSVCHHCENASAERPACAANSVHQSCPRGSVGIKDPYSRTLVDEQRSFDSQLV